MPLQRRRKLVIAAVLIIGIGLASFFSWKRGTPYQEPFWSPNHRYYVQKYSNLTLSQFLPVMPGQASDTVAGYIRLYDSNGKLLHETLQSFIRDIEPVWDGRKVYLKGVAEMDEHPWILPGSSE